MIMLEQIIDVVGREIRNNRIYHAIPIDERQVVGRSYGLRQRLCDVRLVEEPLPLQIAQLDVIAIDDCEVTNSGASQSTRLKTAERTASHDGDASIEYAPL